MMDDLISREQAIGIIQTWLKLNGYSYGERNVMGCTIQMLEELPSAQKTGKWIGYNAEDEKWLRDDGSPIFLSCSNCGNSVINNGSPFWYYCPFCGSRNTGCEE